MVRTKLISGAAIFVFLPASCTLAATETLAGVGIYVGQKPNDGLKY